jgi:hypothetical protein
MEGLHHGGTIQGDIVTLLFESMDSCRTITVVAGTAKIELKHQEL